MSAPPLRTSLAAIVLLSAAGVASAEAPAADVPALIDKLAEVADSDIGYSGASWGNPFLPLDGRSSAWGGGLLFQKPEVPSGTLRAIVKEGAAAVPHLIAHLDDKRTTKLTITNDLGGIFERVDRCDYNVRTAKEDPNPKPSGDKEGIFGTPVPGGRHVVTVGDLCFVALGQIVNRRFAASVYVPSGNVLIMSPTDSPALREAVKKQWAGLTPQRHKAALIEDFEKPDSEERRIGACKRLAYYYPDALEPLVLKFLAGPVYDPRDVEQFVRGRLYAAGGAKELHDLFDNYVAKHGEAARDGILTRLFLDLMELEAREQGRPSDLPKEVGDQPRRLLIELYGKPKDVKAADMPRDSLLDALVPSDKPGFIREALIYDDSHKVDAAVRDLLAGTDDDYLGFACMTRLVGRGYDEDIEKYCRRRLPRVKEEDKKYFQEYLGKLGWTRLHTAVERGDVDEIRRRIGEKMDVNAAAKDGRTPLHLAAAAGDLEAVRALLDGKTALDPKDSAGRTPVELAAQHGYDDVVLLLAEHGCDLPDILSAAAAGKTEVVEGLLKKDPKQAATTNDREATPLHLAAWHGHAKTVAALLAAGAAVSAGDKDGWTPLHLAVDGGHEDVARVLLDNKADPNAVNNRVDKLSPLHAAVLSRKRELVDLLINHGADPNIGHDGEHGSPLHLAVKRGLPDMVAALLDKGATVDVKDKDGWARLHLAAQAGREDMARLLMNHKANVDCEGKDGRRPLHEAAGFGHRKVVELLLDRKASVGACDAAGRTALHLAADGHRPEIVALLLDRGADVNVTDSDGLTPLCAALNFPGATEVVRILLEHKADPRAAERRAGLGPLHLAAATHDRKAVEMLLKHGAAVNAINHEGETPLHWAANEDDPGVVEDLLLHGAAVNAQDKEGATPLHRAVANGNLAICKTLLDHKADPTIKNAKGETPLDLLPAKGEQAKQAAEIKRLLEQAISKM